MDTNNLIDLGNTYREQRNPSKALECYAQVFVSDPDNQAAWNNYGNVMREIGRPDRAVPFLEHCLRLNPAHPTANFNLAVCHLLMGNYKKGWDLYESRWNYEHLQGQLPNLPNRWQGESLKDKTILVLGEQGLGDSIQFGRFMQTLSDAGARVILQVPSALVPVFGEGDVITKTIDFDTVPPKHDYWTPIMSVPGILGIDLPSLNSPVGYLEANKPDIKLWRDQLGIKNKIRVGICWSGRRDSWINQHKSVPFELIKQMIRETPNYEWINLQADASEDEIADLRELGVRIFPEIIPQLNATAALIANIDVVVTVDTAVAHLSGAMGRPTWIMLNHYAVDWRWLLDRNDSPWYPTAKLFRQPSMDQWQPVLEKIQKFLKVFTI